MIKVHVWLPDFAHVGHVALTIGTVYVSFWPDGTAGKKDLKIKRSHPGAFIASLQDDIINEGNRQPITVPTLSQNASLQHVIRNQVSYLMPQRMEKLAQFLGGVSGRQTKSCVMHVSYRNENLLQQKRKY